MASENKVYLQHSFKCDQETLFDWLTKPELIGQWFGPEGFSTGNVQCELVEGGAYSIELIKVKVPRFTVQGEYIEIRRPIRLRFSYRYLGLENPPPPSIVRFDLMRTTPDQTELSMVQEFEIETPDFATRSKAWVFMFDKLEGLI
ncbi:MAG: SRPBCC domain-containing protein [Cyclobacteriaceae bacterium]